MSDVQNRLAEIRQKEYQLRLVVDRLRREVYQQADPSASSERFEELAKAEQELEAVEEQLSAAWQDDSKSGPILDTELTFKLEPGESRPRNGDDRSY